MKPMWGIVSANLRLRMFLLYTKLISDGLEVARNVDYAAMCLPCVENDCLCVPHSLTGTQTRSGEATPRDVRLALLQHHGGSQASQKYFRHQLCRYLAPMLPTGVSHPCWNTAMEWPWSYALCLLDQAS